MNARRALLPHRVARSLWSAALVLASSAALPAAVEAQQPRVAIAAAAEWSLADPHYTDPRDRLSASGRFAAVDLVDVVARTPTLAQLLAYDAVITWSNVPYADANALGEVLADYVDAGGGVVVAPFANATGNPGFVLGGRWGNGAYEIVPPGAGSRSGQANLGADPPFPLHPLLQGVAVFDGGPSSFRPAASRPLNTGTVVAEWSDGAILIAVDPALPTRVDLGIYPPSDTVASGSFWVGDTDGDVLLANALAYAAGQPPTGPFLDAPALVAGQSATLAVQGATPGGSVDLAWSAFGNGPTLVASPTCGTFTVGLAMPIGFLPPQQADASGAAQFTGVVPLRAAGRDLWIQAFDRASCRLSNGAVRSVP